VDAARLRLPQPAQRCCPWQAGAVHRGRSDRHRDLANAIAAIKPEWSEWNTGDASKQAWKDFVRGIQRGELVVTAVSATRRSAE
jgi:hypothetical protein